MLALHDEVFVASALLTDLAVLYGVGWADAMQLSVLGEYRAAVGRLKDIV